MSNKNMNEIVLNGSHKPIIRQSKRGKLLKCQIRNKDVIATEEEVVRQKILKWLLVDKEWDKEQIELETNLTYSDNRRRRPDIILMKNNIPILIVECKKSSINISSVEVQNQAQEYAIHKDMKVKEIWLTNGKDHVFLHKKLNVKWIKGDSNVLDQKSSYLENSRMILPTSLEKDLIKSYWTEYSKKYSNLNGLHKKKNIELAKLALSIHKLIYKVTPAKLPYSYKGLHILEDRGIRVLNIGNASDGGYQGEYRIFLVATEGRVETVGLSIHRNYEKEDQIYLCIAFIKPNRKHHTLQLDIKKYIEKDGTVFHDGRMSSTKNKLVIQAVDEACREDLIMEQESKIRLGVIPEYNKIDWKEKEVKKLLCNLFHYGHIRSGLREANSNKKINLRTLKNNYRLNGKSCERPSGKAHRFIRWVIN